MNIYTGITKNLHKIFVKKSTCMAMDHKSYIVSYKTLFSITHSKQL